MMELQELREKTKRYERALHEIEGALSYGSAHEIAREALNPCKDITAIATASVDLPRDFDLELLPRWVWIKALGSTMPLNWEFRDRAERAS